MPENSGVCFFFKHIVCPQTNPSSTHMQHVCFCVCHGTCVEVKGQLSGVRSLLLLVLNSLSCQACAVSARAISPALGLVCFNLFYVSTTAPPPFTLPPSPFFPTPNPQSPPLPSIQEGAGLLWVSSCSKTEHFPMSWQPGFWNLWNALFYISCWLNFGHL